MIKLVNILRKARHPFGFEFEVFILGLIFPVGFNFMLLVVSMEFHDSETLTLPIAEHVSLTVNVFLIFLILGYYSY